MQQQLSVLHCYMTNNVLRRYLNVLIIQKYKYTIFTNPLWKAAQNVIWYSRIHIYNNTSPPSISGLSEILFCSEIPTPWRQARPRFFPASISSEKRGKSPQRIGAVFPKIQNWGRRVVFSTEIIKEKEEWQTEELGGWGYTRTSTRTDIIVIHNIYIYTPYFVLVSNGLFRLYFFFSEKRGTQGSTATSI